MPKRSVFLHMLPKGRWTGNAGQLMTKFSEAEGFKANGRSMSAQSIGRNLNKALKLDLPWLSEGKRHNKLGQTYTISDAPRRIIRPQVQDRSPLLFPKKKELVSRTRRRKRFYRSPQFP